MTESLWTDLLAVPFSQRYYDVNGIRTRVLEAGTPGAPGLLLLHGVWPQFEEPDLFNRVHIEFLSGRRVRGRV